jgi:hypothetical protein
MLIWPKPSLFQSQYCQSPISMKGTVLMLVVGVISVLEGPLGHQQQVVGGYCSPMATLSIGRVGSRSSLR